MTIAAELDTLAARCRAAAPHPAHLSPREGRVMADSTPPGPLRAVTVTVRIGEAHPLPACRTPAELAQALRTLADEIAEEAGFDRGRWPRLVRTAEGGWAGVARLSAASAEAHDTTRAPLPPELVALLGVVRTRLAPTLPASRLRDEAAGAATLAVWLHLAAAQAEGLVLRDAAASLAEAARQISELAGLAHRVAAGATPDAAP